MELHILSKMSQFAYHSKVYVHKNLAQWTFLLSLDHFWQEHAILEMGQATVLGSFAMKNKLYQLDTFYLLKIRKLESKLESDFILILNKKQDS